MNISDEALREAAASVREALAASLPPPEDCHHDFSPAFLRKMNRLLRRQRHPRVYRALHQAAAVFLAILIGAGTWLAVDTEARAAFVQWVKEVYETHVVYRFRGDAAETVEYRPTWLPEGYEEISAGGPPENRMVIYQNEEGLILSFLYTTLQDGLHTRVDLKDFVVSSVNMSGENADFYYSENPQLSNNLFWVDSEKNISFAISGFLDESVMVHIAKSIYLSNPTK